MKRDEWLNARQSTACAKQVYLEVLKIRAADAYLAMLELSNTSSSLGCYK